MSLKVENSDFKNINYLTASLSTSGGLSIKNAFSSIRESFRFALTPQPHKVTESPSLLKKSLKLIFFIFAINANPAEAQQYSFSNGLKSPSLAPTRHLLGDLSDEYLPLFVGTEESNFAYRGITSDLFKNIHTGPLSISLESKEDQLPPQGVQLTNIPMTPLNTFNIPNVIAFVQKDNFIYSLLSTGYISATDYTDPLNPFTVSILQLSLPANSRKSLSTSGTNLYCWINAGFYQIDITNPAQMSALRFYSTNYLEYMAVSDNLDYGMMVTRAYSELNQGQGAVYFNLFNISDPTIILSNTTLFPASVMQNYFSTVVNQVILEKNFTYLAMDYLGFVAVNQTDLGQITSDVYFSGVAIFSVNKVNNRFFLSTPTQGLLAIDLTRVTNGTTPAIDSVSFNGNSQDILSVTQNNNYLYVLIYLTSSSTESLYEVDVSNTTSLQTTNSANLQSLGLSSGVGSITIVGQFIVALASNVLTTSFVSIPRGNMFTYSGTIGPNTKGNHSLAFTSYGPNGLAVNQTIPFTFQINPAVTVASQTQPTLAIVNSFYNYNPPAFKGASSYFAILQNGDPLPQGLTVNSASGALSGTLTAAGDYPIRLYGATALGSFAYRDLTISAAYQIEAINAIIPADIWIVGVPTTKTFTVASLVSNPGNVNLSVAITVNAVWLKGVVNPDTFLSLIGEAPGPGTTVATIKFTDPHGLTAQMTYAANAQGVIPPIVQPLEGVTFNVGTQSSVTISPTQAVSTIGGIVTYSINNNPKWTSFEGYTLSGSPKNTDQSLSGAAQFQAQLISTVSFPNSSVTASAITPWEFTLEGDSALKDAFTDIGYVVAFFGSVLAIYRIWLRIDNDYRKNYPSFQMDAKEGEPFSCPLKVDRGIVNEVKILVPKEPKGCFTNVVKAIYRISCQCINFKWLLDQYSEYTLENFNMTFDPIKNKVASAKLGKYKNYTNVLIVSGRKQRAIWQGGGARIMVWHTVNLVAAGENKNIHQQKIDELNEFSPESHSVISEPNEHKQAPGSPSNRLEEFSLGINVK